MAPAEIVWFVFSVLAFAAVGSFCCVVIDRWPASPGEMFGGQSRCSSCGEPIRRSDNVPVVSWLVLRGRCRRCRSGIPAYHPVVEAAIPAMWTLAVVTLGWSAELIVVGWSVPVGVTAAMILTHGAKGLERSLAISGAIVALIAGAIALGRGDADPMLGCVLGMGATGGPLAASRAIRSEGFTAGDVMLAVTMGGAVGVIGATKSLVAAAAWAMVGLTVAALVAVAHAGVRRRSHDPLSFAPSLVIGACAAMLGAATIGV